MTMCTCSIDYDCFNLNKVFIKVYSIIYPWRLLFVLLLNSSCIIANSSHTDQTFTDDLFLFTIVAFSSTESLTEYLITPSCILGHNHIIYILPVSHRHAISFFQIYIMWLSSCVSNFIKSWGLSSYAEMIHRNLAGLFLLLTNVLLSS